MAKIRPFTAILLALVLSISPATMSLADDPGTYDASGGNTTDGHPWDDDVVETDPDDPNTPGPLGSNGGITLPHPTTASAGGSGAGFFAQAIMLMLDSWLRVSELKSTKSKAVIQRVR